MSKSEIMSINWLDLIMPEKVQVSSTQNYCKLVCEPLERGFGTTIGNSLRRVILSSLFGAAITSVRIENVEHEYSVLPGVLEDVSEIILNLKQVRLKTKDYHPRKLVCNAKGEGVVTAGQFVSPDGAVEILNPQLPIATVSNGAVLNMEMSVKIGKGYSLSEANKEEDAPFGTIPIDAIFSPIQKVNYVVSNARVGQRTDYDKLTLEVWTNGSVSPEDAVAYAAKILKEQLTIFISFNEDEQVVQAEKMEREEDSSDFNENLFRSVDELELSVRSANCLKNADIKKIYQLVQKSEAEMLKTKNFGRKSLHEIKEVLNDMGLALGMKLEGFEPPKDEIEEEGE